MRSPAGSSETGGVFGIYLVSNILVVWDIPLRLLSCTYFSSFFAASAWAEESPKSNTIPDLANSACETHISIHAPAKGATPFSGFLEIFPFSISIHAPAKGATGQGNHYFLIEAISIHAPAKGATMFQKQKMDWERISIHAPAKGATECREQDCKAGKISIHAPTKGATFRLSGLTPMRRFQSTLPRRERPDYPILKRNMLLFQSTLPRRERRCR